MGGRGVYWPVAINAGSQLMRPLNSVVVGVVVGVVVAVVVVVVVVIEVVVIDVVVAVVVVIVVDVIVVVVVVVVEVAVLVVVVVVVAVCIVLIKGKPKNIQFLRRYDVHVSKQKNALTNANAESCFNCN